MSNGRLAQAWIRLSRAAVAGLAVDLILVRLLALSGVAVEARALTGLFAGIMAAGWLTRARGPGGWAATGVAVLLAVIAGNLVLLALFVIFR